MTITTPHTSQSGARWIRAALQVNPFEYHGRNAPSTRFPDEAAYNAALLAECRAQHIEMIAVTDHWCVDSAAGLIADGRAAGIIVLPGFEASSSEGIHLLVIFEDGTDRTSINGAIGACGVTPGCDNGTTGHSFKEIMKDMTARGALVIPAHVNVANSGMLTGRSGVPLVEMVKNPNLHVIGITPSVADGIDQQAIIAGTKPYDRIHPLASIFSDDISHPVTLKTEGAATWFKASVPRLESLKLAVRTPATRISTANPSATPRALIREISWEGGFLDGVTIPLADDLTTLIGGRGTGKSTVIESLRYALDVEPLGVDAQKDHKGIISKVLRSGTTITVSVDVIHPSPGHFVIERSVPNPPIVKDASNTPTSLRPQDVIGMVEIFGQHELAELSQDKDSVARMLERFAGHEDAGTAREDLLQRLADNRGKLERLESDRERLEEDLADIPRLTEQVDHYAASDLENRLKEQKRLQQDETVISEAHDRVENVQTVISNLSDDSAVVTLSTPIEGIAGSANETLLKRAETAATTLATVIRDANLTLKTAIETANAEITAVKDEWTKVTEVQRAGHAKVLRELIDEGHDPAQYLAATAALESLTTKSQRRAGFETQKLTLTKAREGLLRNLVASDTALSKQLTAAVRKANDATGGVVIVRPIASPDRQALKGAITRHTSGQRTQIMTAVEAVDFSPRAFVEAARLGATALQSKYEIRGAQQLSIISAGEPLFRELEEMGVGQAVDVLLDVSPTPGTRDYRRLEELSKGQRATALLLLLLGASMSPLIIDQPEDDLDNRFVYEGIVQKLRGLKGQRQIIVSTHNANVPVLGDAELVVTLEGNGVNGWPTENGVGSLDDATVRALAEDLLEGGRAAFDARQHLYGF